MALPFITNTTKKVIVAQVFSADRTSSVYENVKLESKSCSLHINWGINAPSGVALTGSVDGTIKLQVSNDGINFIDKSNMTFTLATDGAAATSGSGVKNLHMLLKERFVRVLASHVSISGGTIEVFLSLNK